MQKQLIEKTVGKPNPRQGSSYHEFHPCLHTMCEALKVNSQEMKMCLEFWNNAFSMTLSFSLKIPLMIPHHKFRALGKFQSAQFFLPLQSRVETSLPWCRRVYRTFRLCFLYIIYCFELALNKDLISLASFAQSVTLQLSSLFRTVESCAVKWSKTTIFFFIYEWCLLVKSN